MSEVLKLNAEARLNKALRTARAAGFRSKVTLIFGRRTRAANDPLEEQAVGHL